MKKMAVKTTSIDAARHMNRTNLFLGIALLSSLVLCNSDKKSREAKQEARIASPLAGRQSCERAGYLDFLVKSRPASASETGIEALLRTPGGVHEYCDSVLQPQLDSLYRSFQAKPLALENWMVEKIIGRFEGVRISLKEGKTMDFSGMTFPFLGRYHVISMVPAFNHECTHVASGIKARAAWEMVMYSLRDDAGKYGSPRWARHNKELAVMEAFTGLLLRDTCYWDMYYPPKLALEELPLEKRKGMLDCFVLCALNFATPKQERIAKDFLMHAIEKYGTPEKKLKIFGMPVMGQSQ